MKVNLKTYKDAPVDYLRMPEKVCQIDDRVNRIERNFDRLLSMVGRLDEEDSAQVAEGQRRLGEYPS